MFCVLLLTTVCLYAQTLTCVTLYARVSLHIVRRYLHNIAYHVTWLNEHINKTRKGGPSKIQLLAKIFIYLQGTQQLAFMIYSASTKTSNAVSYQNESFSSK